MTSLADQAVLVTGANRGMGREYAAQLLDRGVTKVYAAARDPRTIDVQDPRVVPLSWMSPTRRPWLNRLRLHLMSVF